MIIFGFFLPSLWLVRTTKAYSGLGATLLWNQLHQLRPSPALRGDAAEVRCSGRLVAGVNDRLYLEVSQLIPSSKRILPDLTDLTQMDSTGLGTLVRLYVSARSAGCALQLSTLGNRFGNFLAPPVFCRYWR
jgi:ABC-type transporter Mla MlaB component